MSSAISLAGKKPRADSKLLNLPENDQATLADALLGGMSYAKAQQMLLKDLGIQCSLSALSVFWEQVCAPVLLQRRAQAVKTADLVAEAVAATPGKFDAILTEQLKQRAFELLVNPQSKADALMLIMSTIQKAKDQDLTEKKLNLARDKFEFDAAEAALANAEKLKTISQNPSLDQTAKVDAARRVLYGEDAV